MKYTFSFLLLVSVVVSCNLNTDRKLSDKELKELEKAHNDSIAVVIDSLNHINIYVPPLYDKEVFDSATTVKFFELAKSTHGELKLLVNSKLITTEIINILKMNGADNADLLILMDKTGSMSDDIEYVQKGLNQVIDVLKTFKNVRLGIALYGDKNEDKEDWFSFKNFETHYAAAKQFVNQIEVSNGGDYPESVYEGFFKACEQNFWRSATKRMIILIGDAPPLENPLSKYKVTDVIVKAGEDNIKMNFYPIVVTPIAEDLPANTTINTFEKEKIVAAVFPNPATTTLNLNLVSADSYSIEIFNTSGAIVSSDNFTGNLWKKDVSTLQNGAYVARVIRKDKKFETVKFVVYK